MSNNHQRSSKVFNNTVREVPPKAFTPVLNMVAAHMHPVAENEAGIVLPDGSENPSQTNICTAVAVGPDCRHVKEGDQFMPLPVLIPNIVHKGRIYAMFREDQIAGIMVESERIKE